LLLHAGSFVLVDDAFLDGFVDLTLGVAVALSGGLFPE
jgi:hypothetical protein